MATKTFSSYAGNIIKTYSTDPPRLATEDEIPIISLATEKTELVKQIKHACTQVGFFYLKDHGVPIEAMKGILAAAEEFFDLPMEEKQELDFRNSKNLRGYEPYSANYVDKSLKPDVNEQFNWGYDPSMDKDATEATESWSDDNPMAGGNVWPKRTNLKSAATEYYGEILQLARKLARYFALALDIEENYFDDLLKTPGAMTRILYYPSQEINDDTALGIGAHTDIECFTLLLTDSVPALQILNSEGKWIIAPPRENMFVVNIGDMLARWSNDKFLSTIHRVRNITGQKRYSVPCFIGVNYDTIITPLPSCIGEKGTIYEPVRAGDYVYARLKTDRVTTK